MSVECPHCGRRLARIAQETIRANRYVCSCGRTHWRCQWPRRRGAKAICGAVIIDGAGRPVEELVRWCRACHGILAVDAPRPVEGGH